MAGTLASVDGLMPELIHLMKGEPVALRFGQRNRIFVLVPGSSVGLEEDALLIAGVGARCEIIDTRRITLTPMLRAGLSAEAANVLRVELQRIYEYGSKIIEG